jgi:hypothetical protein
MKRFLIVASVLLALSLSLGLAANAGPAVTVFRAIRVTVQAVFSGPVTMSGAASLESTLDVDGAVNATSTLQVDGAATLSDALTVQGASAAQGGLAVSKLLSLEPGATLTVTTTISPTSTYTKIAAASWVTATLGTGYTAGDRVTLQNAGAENISIADTTGQLLASTFAMTPDDTLSLIFDGASWVELGRSVN